jgi:protein gp37
MGDRSAIEWTDASWSPIRARNKKTGKVGWHCSHASEGCRNCYAESINRRLGTGLDFKPGHKNDVEIFLDEEMLLRPLRWKRPRKIFVCSMTDFFADFVKDEWIDKIFAVAALCPEHTFQCLTKRSKRLLSYCSDAGVTDRITEAIGAIIWPDALEWPLPNVWLGVSVEDQGTADERIPDLLATPAAVRFVSYEPALGPINFRRVRVSPDHHVMIDALDGYALGDSIAGSGQERTHLHWIIAAGEIGPNAKPPSIQWMREARDQCTRAGIAFFFKQWGEWAPAGLHRSEDPGRFAFGDYDHDRSLMIQTDSYPRQFTKFGSHSTMKRVGKNRAGRLLDGVEWNQFPSSARAIVGQAPEARG